MKEKLSIVKVGGAVVENAVSLAAFLERFVSLEGRKALVHGGGRVADTLCHSLGIEPKMVGGRRITDEKTLEVVTMVYGGLVNKNIVASLQAKGLNALGLSGADLGWLLAHKRPVKEIDYGFAGDVERTDTELLSLLVERGVVPVFAPLSFDAQGQILNTNADTVASSAAVSFAGKFDVSLYYCFEKSGVLADPSREDSVIAEINREMFTRLKSDGTIAGGMIPKIENAFAALGAGVSEVIITSASALGAGGCGTRIVL